MDKKRQHALHQTKAIVDEKNRNSGLVDNESMIVVNKESSEQGSHSRQTKTCGESGGAGEDNSHIGPKVATTAIRLSRQNSNKHLLETNDQLTKKRYYMKQGLLKDRSECTKRQSVSKGEKASQNSHSQNSKHNFPTSNSTANRMACRLPGKDSIKQISSGVLLNSLMNNSLYQ